MAPTTKQTPDTVRTLYHVTASEIAGEEVLPALDLWSDTESEVEARERFHTLIEDHPDHHIAVQPRVQTDTTDASDGILTENALLTYDPREENSP